MSDETPDPGLMTFIENGDGDGDGDTFNQEELDCVLTSFVADLLEHADDHTYVRDRIVLISLIDDLPVDLFFGATIRILVTHVLDMMQQSSPLVRSGIRLAARLYREQASGGPKEGTP